MLVKVWSVDQTFKVYIAKTIRGLLSYLHFSEHNGGIRSQQIRLYICLSPKIVFAWAPL